MFCRPFHRRGNQAVREDVAGPTLDKLIGWALAEGEIPLGYLLLVSGRVSYEIVQKAVSRFTAIDCRRQAPSSWR